MRLQHGSSLFFKTALTLGAVLICAVSAQAALMTVRTSDGNGADTELREDESLQRGASQDLNTRWESPPVNLEIIALRFDLTGVNRSLISGASLEMMANRNLPANQGIQYWGLNSSVSGQNWTEGVANSTWNALNPFPGLTHDSDLTTLPINAADTTSLGSVSWTSFPLAGDFVALSNQDLIDFLKNGTGNLATFFALRLNASPTTQVRFASKENEALGNTGSVVPPTIHPERAPRLVLNLVPEPASFALMGLGAIGVVSAIRRRR